MLQKKLILMLCIFLVLVSSCYALDFDNVKEFKTNDKYGEISIINTFGLGSELAKFTLERNSDYCFKDCYAEGTAIINEESNLFDDIKFIDLKDKDLKEKTLEDIKYFIKKEKYETITYNDYETICNDILNKTTGKINKVCVEQISNTYTQEELTYYWEEYNGKVLPIGTYEWRIEATKEPGETVDWIVTAFGEELTEWATWADLNLNTNLEQYWSFDSDYTTGNTVKDSVNSDEGTNDGADQVAGLINQAYDFVLGNTDKINVSGNFTDWTNLATSSVNFWFKTDNVGGTEKHILGSSGDQTFYIRITGTGTIKVLQISGAVGNYFETTESYNDDVYHMATLLKDGVNLALYIDGDYTNSIAQATFSSNTAQFIGSSQSAGEEFDGLIDEIGIWSENLTVAKIEGLYNGGAGLAYPATEDSSIYNVNTTFNAIDYDLRPHEYLLSFNLNESQVVNTSINASLYYGSDKYTMTQDFLIGNSTQYSVSIPKYSIDSPELTSFYYSINYEEVIGGALAIYNDSNQTQTIEPTLFQDCNETFTVPFINYTFKDEGNSSSISAAFTDGDFVYGVGDLTLNKTFSYSNLTELPSFAFCSKTEYGPLALGYNIRYNAVGYQQRINKDTLTVSDTVTNKDLFLLLTDDGLFVTFQVLTLAEQTIKEVNLVVTDDDDNIITEGFTDDAGTITVFLDPNKVYTFTFSKENYDTFITRLAPTQTSYTITMSSQTTTEGQNLFQGINYVIGPTLLTLQNTTSYNFSFDVTSSYYELESSGFSLLNESGQLIGLDACINTAGCSSSITASTGSNKNVTMQFYWTIDGNITTMDKVWLIKNIDTTNSSIGNLVKDLTGFEGLDNFTKFIISLIIIMLIIGGLTMKFGVNSPLAISGVVFALVGFLDLINMLPAVGTTGIGEHFITIVVGLMVGGFIINEFR